MARDLLTIRCPEDIRQAIEERMTATGKAKTDVVLDLLRTALGMPSTTTNEVSTTLLDERITMLLDNRTTLLYEQVNARVEEEIRPVKEALAAMVTQWEEYKKERQETYNQWFNETLELGRELERSKQQSPYPDRLASESAIVAEISKPSSELVEEGEAKLIQEHKLKLKALTSPKLEKRLGVSNGTISRNKDLGNEHFRKWSAERDQDGVAWEYREGASPRFHPLVESSITQ